MPEIIDIIETNEKAPALLPWQWLLIVCVGLALLIALIIFLKRQKSSTKKINNLQQALTALKEIQESSSTEKDINRLSIELSLLTRAYLQGRFSNNSIFQTHEEFIQDHEDLEKLPLPAREKLASYLSSLAEQKYAPNPHLASEKNKLIELTESLLKGIDSTIPKEL